MISDPEANDAEETPASSEEELSEHTEQTAQVMADARRKVERAKETLHDQLLPAARAVDEEEFEDQEAGAEREDTRGAWPNWS